MTPKWQLAIIKGGEREVAFLKGRIFLNKQGKTQVKFTVRPNYVLTLFFLITPIFGIGAAVSALQNGDKTELLFVGLGITFLIPLVMLTFIGFAKKSIKERFVQTFGLTLMNDSLPLIEEINVYQ